MSNLEGTVLVVDDNIVDRLLVKRSLRDTYVVLEAESAASGLRMAREARPDCVLLDNLLPDRDGLDALSDYCALGVPVIIHSGCEERDAAREAQRMGAAGFVRKGQLGQVALLRAIREARRQTRDGETQTRDGETE